MTTDYQATDRLYLRHSTDKQTNARQKHALAEWLDKGFPTYEDPATSSRIHAAQREGFGRLMAEAGIGDNIRIADAARLFRSVKDVIEIRETCQKRGIHLYVASGAWSGFDLAGTDKQTKLFVSVLASVLEFQRDLIGENTKAGMAATKKKLGRPTKVTDAVAVDILNEYRAGGPGNSIKAIARRHDIAVRSVHRVLDDAGVRSTALVQSEPVVAPVDQYRVTVPWEVSDFLGDNDDPEIRTTLDNMTRVRNATVATADQETLERIRDLSWVMGDAKSTEDPKERAAWRRYRDALAKSVKSGPVDTA
ncbi:recombinase family protein [Streptomyces sp. H34-S4]|uniref:recombinase family protein n=1 Tax=Streptomyces sp. H34-S4 TaxID=2996463 RepID=UPI00226FB6F2|nr:recombinase family protein [Streptomyces sp. H34-S4]MCY0937776.1 recombinase family protein [Streptomyces sp. H34-S4]